MNVCRAFQEEEVNNSTAVTEKENLYTDLWKNCDSVICNFLFLIHLHKYE